jgi:preprotein translocase subunit SecD
VPRGAYRAWFIIPAVVVLLVIWTILSARSGDSLSKPFEGRDAAVVTLLAPDGGGAAAAPRLVEWLVALGIDSEVVEATNGRIRVALRRVADPAEAIHAVTTPDPLSLHVVLEDAQQAAADGPRAGDAAEPAHLRPWLMGTSRADLRARIDRAGAPAGLTPLVECIPGPDRKGPPLCAAWLGTAAGITSRDVREIHLGADARTEEPLVHVTFTPEGARAFEALTRGATGKMLAVIALGEIQARARIDVAIPDGKWTFSTRTADTTRPVAVQRAQRIAKAVNLPPLPPLVIETVQGGGPSN